VYSKVSDVIRKRNSTAGTDVNLDGGTAANWDVSLDSPTDDDSGTAADEE
jgi:hypothetical protein